MQVPSQDPFENGSIDALYVNGLQEASAREKSTDSLLGQALGDGDGLLIDVVLRYRVAVGGEDDA